ncbi:MAG: dipeptidase, partial [Maricaulaceae bacterium]
DAAFFILYSQQGPLTEEGYATARATVENKHGAIVRMTRAYPDQISLATSASEARRAVREGRLVAFMGMENAYPLGESVADVPMWAERGVRYMGITHFGHNQFGDSSAPRAPTPMVESLHDGLSPLGEELVAALNRAGVMVDVSHAGRETMMQATALSQAPIIASHSGTAALFEHNRNLDDEQLRALAANGGVIQVVAFESYIAETPPERTAAVAELQARLGLDTPEAQASADAAAIAAYTAEAAVIAEQYPIATVSTLVDHIDHAVAVAGIDHVGIASDFDGGGGIGGWRDASQTQAVTEELLARGYSAQDIAKIWGGNLLRVLDEVEAVGRRLRVGE